MTLRTWFSARTGLGLGVLGAVALVTTATCAPAFDTTRVEGPRAETVGGDVFGVVCERVDVSENPTDIDFSRARPVCAGLTMDPCMSAEGGVGPRVCAMASKRTAIVGALDRVAPMSLHRPLDQLLQQLLPLYGPQDGRFTMGALVDLPDGTQAPAEDLLPRTTRSVSELLRSLIRDEEVVSAISRISFREGTRPARLALGATQAMLSYPRMGQSIERMMSLLRPADGDRPAGAGNPQLNILLDVARSEMSRAAPAPASPAAVGTTLDAVMDLVFRQDDALSTGKPRLIVRRDSFGMPRVARAMDGSLPMPFVDANSDGAADSQGGRFVAAGRVLNVPTPFATTTAAGGGMRDPEGRALTNLGPMFEYVDLDRTLMGALMRDTRSLVRPDNNIALQLARSASGFFGPRRMVTRDDASADAACPTDEDPRRRCRPPALQYNSFDATGSAPALDLLHALGILLGHREVDPVLETAQQLMTNHAGLLARNTAAMLAIDRVSDMTPAARMDARSVIWDDVVDIVRDISRKPGLLEDLLTAVQDPATEQWMRAFATFTVHRDRVEPDWTSASRMNASLASRTFSQRVDYARSDIVDQRVGPDGVTSYGPNDNRSIMQRFLHLVYDLDGVRMCNKNGARVITFGIPLPGTYSACEIFEVPDAAVFYLQTVIGTGNIEMKPGFLRLAGNISPALMDGILSRETEIEGFDTTPTPQAVNRMVFAPDVRRTAMLRGLMDPPVTRDGRPVREVHPGTIFTWETSGFYNGLMPLARAFNRHEGGLKLFVRIMSAMHLHWATASAGGYQSTDPMRPLYSRMSGARNYEPIISAAMAGDFPAASRELVTVLPRLNVGGRTGRDVIAQAVRMFVDPAQFAGIAYRDGRTTTTRSDGTTRVDQPSLFHLFADAFNAMDPVLDAPPATRTSWESARSSLVDTFMGTTGTGATTTFSNRQIPVISRHLLQWARQRIAVHRTAGDLDPWARGMSRRAAEVTSGPAFSAGYDLLAVLDTDVPARTAAGDMLSYFLDDSGTNPDNPFGLTLTAMGDALQMLRVDSDIDPLLRAMAPAMQRRVTSTEGVEITDGLLMSSLRLLDRSRQYDTNQVLDRVLMNLVSRPNPNVAGDEPISVLADAIAENTRVRPNENKPLSTDDVRRIFGEVESFFSDRSRGLEQFYYIVQHRRL
ncbi:MAG: hypothetical protein Q8Q09_19065 [Deltaproteobacteria bacterium]|nr:hypothetical protein [Deltaproteobacteria bacterium]